MIGVLALQGAFALHVEALERCGASTTLVRTPNHLEGLDAIVIPGGESSTMSKLLDMSGMRAPLGDRLAAGMPAFGTCAGMILLASNVLDGRADQRSFAAIDLTVRRNGYGRQIDSFEADLVVAELGQPPLPAIFIRAPVVEAVGAGVEVLAEVGDAPVLCRHHQVLVASFHPELSNDDRLHQAFLNQL